MNGLELSKAYFETFGKPMLEEQFQDILPFLAIGLFGSGSECLGVDDEVSQDHDFEPGFCIFLPGEEMVDRSKAFQLERAYQKLPKTFEGFTRSALSPVGGNRHGVLRTADFFLEKVGSCTGDLTLTQWLALPDHALLEATNGALFLDSFGEVTAIRQKLAHYPEDIRRKKLAGQLLLMAQAGQYNYMRLLKHHEPAAAQIAVYTFAQSCMQVIFLLNHRYMPYYKWSFRMLRALPHLALEAELLEYLITTDNSSELSEDKYQVIESIAADIIDELMQQHLTKAICGDLEKHAYSVNDGIADASIRNLHILAAV